MRLRFLTSTPLDVRRGSGTYAGIRTLAEALRAQGHEVELAAPRVHLPVYTAERLLFNATLRPQPGFDVTVGFDMDGYRLAGRGQGFHVASIKGVIADELRFQTGLTRLTMSVQARCERLHARRADLVITTSHYAASAIQKHYRARAEVVPELIDLAAWRKLLEDNPAAPEPNRFTVLAVCRLYRRKRIDVLLRAAARLNIPGLAVRIVGDGPEAGEFRSVYRALHLGARVQWLGDVTQARLAAEYNRCDIFCLPSVQEGFGIVFLEAMAAGKPIVAAHAAAVPEVVTQGMLAKPGDAVSLANEIERLYRDPALRARLKEEGHRRVRRFDAPTVAGLFLEKIAKRRPSPPSC